jgi:hypothetical protein
MHDVRTVYGLVVVGVALFISGIGFIIAGARTMRTAAPGDAPVATPVASIKQIMNGIVMPGATVIYNAVGTTSTAAGVVETAPRNDEEWTAVGNSAAALVESGNLLLLGGRALDNGDWVRITREFIAAGKAALKAAEAKDVDGIFTAGGDINATCDTCHAKYRRP